MSNRNYDKLVVAAEQSTKERDFWLDRLAGTPVKSVFTYDHPAGTGGGFPSARLPLSFDADTVSKLMKLSKGSDVKLHMVLAAGLAALLHKYTGSSDVIFGTPIYKQEVEIEFLNTVLVLRNRVDENATFKELLLLVRQTLTEAAEHQNYPLEILLEQLGMPYRPGSDDFPLFDVVLLHENIHHIDYLRQEYVHYYLLFSFNRSGEAVNAAVEYNPGVYREKTARRIFSHYNRLLSNALSNVDTPLSGVEMMSEEEKQRILNDFNSNTADIPDIRTLHGSVEVRAAETPDRVVLVSEEVLNDLHLTYGELNRRANQLARFLRERGARPGSIVGLMVEKSLEMMVGIVGILKSGAAYLPIDLAYPAGRIEYMLKESGTRLLLTYGGNTVPAAVEIARKPGLNLELINIFSPRIYRGDASDLESLNHSEDAAYIIYTSGSTGKPKGVVVEHRNVIAYLTAFYCEFEITDSDIALQQASYSFDVFVEEIYPFLNRSGRIVICPKYVIMDTAALSRFILKHRVTFISVSPLLLNEIDNLPDPGSIRIFISGGDVLKKEYIANLLKLKERRVYNTYGPTETTVCASYHRCSVDDPPDIPIGRPIANYHVRVLDRQGRLQPVGVPGELCISGPGVARGYLNQPDLTAERFYRSNGACTLYKTGDLAHWLPDGGIRFLGRIDQQVKIRGFRIELGEIENHLLKHDAVDAALVLVKEPKHTGGENAAQRYLCAYIAAKEKISVPDLKEFLAGQLPAYMIPSHYVMLDRMPQTPHGKPDLKVLETYEPESGINSEFIAPGTDMEIAIADTWKELLNLESVGIHDNFFDLGGNSMLLLKVANKIGETLNREIPYVAMFQYTTIHALAEYLSTGERETAAPEQYEEQQAEVLDKGKERMKKFIKRARETEVVNG